MPVRRLAAASAGALLLSVLGACGSDPPTRDEARDSLQAICRRQAPAVRSVERPRDVFELREAAATVYRALAPSPDEVEEADLGALGDDQHVQRYLDGMATARDAMSDLAERAGLEDVAGMRAALERSERGMTLLDRAANRLGLPRRCGSAAWGRDLFDQARRVVRAEAGAMAATGDYPADLDRYCARYQRSAGAAMEPVDATTNRSYAFTMRRAVELFRARVGRLQPPDALARPHRRLVRLLDETATTLVPTERMADEGDVDALQEAVERTTRNARDIDGLLATLGARC